MTGYSPRTWGDGATPICAEYLDAREAGVDTAHSEIHAHTHGGGANDAPSVPWANLSGVSSGSHRTIQILPFTPGVIDEWRGLEGSSTTLLLVKSRVSSYMGDRLAWDILLEAGSWEISLLYVKAIDGPVLAVKLDDTEVGRVDMYASSFVYNLTATFPNVAVSPGGKVRLILEVVAAGTGGGTKARVQMIQLRKTA